MNVHAYAGGDPLAPMPFTEAEVAALVERARVHAKSTRLGAGSSRCTHCGMSGHQKARGRHACSPTFMAAKLVVFGGETVVRAAQIFGVNRGGVYERAQGLRAKARQR